MTAIMHREYAIYCNSPEHHRDNSTAFFGYPQYSISSRARLRRIAARRGWTHVHEPGRRRDDDLDFCPLHKPDGAR